MKLYNSLKPDMVLRDLRSKTSQEVLKEMLMGLKCKGKIPDEQIILEKLLERERLGSTSIGSYAAVPHTKLKDIKEPIIAVGISEAGIRYNELDKDPVHLIILILSPNVSPIIHLQILAAAASLLKRKGSLIKDLLAAASETDVINTIRKYETSDD